MRPGSRPLKAGGVCRAEASVVAVYAGNSGNTVRVSEHALCEVNQVIGFSQHSSSAGLAHGQSLLTMPINITKAGSVPLPLELATYYTLSNSSGGSKVRG